jgi:hypothetical protein
MNSKEIQDTNQLIKELRKRTSQIDSLIRGEQSFIDEFAHIIGPIMDGKVYSSRLGAYTICIISYVDALCEARQAKEVLKRQLDVRGHMPNKAERRKIRQEAAKNKTRKKE